MAVRILRLMEYVYPDHEAAFEDMTHWAVPANGEKSFGQADRRIESAVLPPAVFDPGNACPVGGTSPTSKEYGVAGGDPARYFDGGFFWCTCGAIVRWDPGDPATVAPHLRGQTGG